MHFGGLLFQTLATRSAGRQGHAHLLFETLLQTHHSPTAIHSRRARPATLNRAQPAGCGKTDPHTGRVTTLVRRQEVQVSVRSRSPAARMAGISRVQLET